jgi:hypothetical protein
MSRHFELTFKGGFMLRINTNVSADSRPSCSTGYVVGKGKKAQIRPVRWIKVISKIDEPIEKIDQIAEICEAKKIKSIVQIPGTSSYSIVEKDQLKCLFPNSPVMKVMCVTSSLPYHIFDGSHYVLKPTQTKSGKVRVIASEDRSLYEILCVGLEATQNVLIVGYNAYNSRKYGAVYFANGELRLSLFIGSNYQREFGSSTAIDERAKKLGAFEKLLTLQKSKFVYSKLVDTYGDELAKLVESARAGSSYVSKKIKSDKIDKKIDPLSSLLAM